MKKLILLTLFTLFSCSHAKMLNGIACIVEGEPVTSAEIRSIQRQFHLSKEDATDLLIKDRLQKSAMKDIIVDEDKIDKQIALIASKNKLTIPQMQKIFKKRGVTWTKYRESIRNALKKEKFYQEKILNTIPAPNKDELKLFYKNHKNEFLMPSSISLIEYSAKKKSDMQHFLQTKKKHRIKSRSVTKMTKKLNPTLLETLLQTQNGSYTHPFNAGDRYISYKVVSKNGKIVMPYDMAKNMIEAQWRQKQQSKALKDYFEKLKTNADIQYIDR